MGALLGVGVGPMLGVTLGTAVGTPLGTAVGTTLGRRTLGTGDTLGNAGTARIHGPTVYV